MICILHGYLLEGSGSNLWTREIVRALCADGHTVQLVCQEPDPAAWDFIAEAHVHGEDGFVEMLFRRDSPYPGRCIMHRPQLGDTLPVYVWDQYDEFENVVPMAELGEPALEDYLRRNVDVTVRVVHEHGVRVLHANHAVLMSVAAQRAAAWTGVPYVIMPHGSALEYAVRPDPRLRRLATEAFAHASRVLVISDEVAQRLEELLGEEAQLPGKLARLDLGVDTSAFRPVEPTARARRIEDVKALLADVPRGRSRAHDERLKTSLAAGDDVAVACARVGDYVVKLPDEDVESKLGSVDWDSADVLVFIGRLIAAKGIHAIIGALPSVLAQAPRTRLLVVGHGPLREPLEALVHALPQGDRARAEEALDCAVAQDTGEAEHIDALRAFWDDLEEAGRAAEYWDAARQFVTADSVLFTGYLSHREMSQLLPCCDVAIFPSLVVESGPLVFLEALASGVFPIGTYFGGMKVKIDRVAPELEPEHAPALRVRPDARTIVGDIAEAATAALPLARRYRNILRGVAEAQYDWRPIAARLARILDDVAAGDGR
jgi:glycosyltransferase involved in cell wall biosynthesis